MGIGALGKLDTVSNLKKMLKTNGCPRCSVPIEKNAGCQLMRCSNCNFEFCWECLQDYTGYSHSLAPFPCRLRKNLRFFMYVGLVMLVYIRVSYYCWWLRLINHWVFLFIVLVSHCVYFIVPYIIIYQWYIRLLVNNPYKYPRWSHFQGVTSILAQVVFAVSYFLSYYWGIYSR